MTRQPRSIVWCAATSTTCRPMRGRHTNECLSNMDTKCDGCQPRQAADGLLLCHLCARLLGEDPITLAGRHRDLEGVLAGGTGGLGERVTTKGRDPNVKLNESAVDARADIRYTLAGLVGLVVGERGVHLPSVVMPKRRPDNGFIGPMPLVRYYDTSVPALAAFLARHASWLAAHPGAGHHAKVLRELCSTTFGVAFPAGVRVFPLKTRDGRPLPCPDKVKRRVAFVVTRRGIVSERFGDQPCDGFLWTVLRPNDDRLPAELLCNSEEIQHRWPTSTWMRLGVRVQEALAKSGVTSAGKAEAKRPADRGVRFRQLPGRDAAGVADVLAMTEATDRRSTPRGMALLCKACKQVLGEAPWGVPVDALLGMWERHCDLCGRSNLMGVAA